MRAQSPVCDCVHKAMYACTMRFPLQSKTQHFTSERIPTGLYLALHPNYDDWHALNTLSLWVSCPCWIPAIVARFYYTCTAMQGVRIIWCLFICSKCASLHDFLDDETTSNENVLGILLRRCRGISAFQMHFSLMKTQPICDWPGFQSTQIYV